METIDYTPFGQPTGSGALVQHLSTFYAGRELDPLSGLYYNRARWYDSASGRWVSEDPIGFAAGDANLYRYCGNSPDNATDPSGLDAWTRFEGALQAVFGVVEVVGGGFLILGGGVTEGGSLGVSTPVSVPAMILGGVIAVHGIDDVVTGVEKLCTGQYRPTLTSQAIAATTGSARVGEIADMSIGMAGAFVPGPAAARAAGTLASRSAGAQRIGVLGGKQVAGAARPPSAPDTRCWD